MFVHQFHHHHHHHHQDQDHNHFNKGEKWELSSSPRLCILLSVCMEGVCSFEKFKIQRQNGIEKSQQKRIEKNGCTHNTHTESTVFCSLVSLLWRLVETWAVQFLIHNNDQNNADIRQTHTHIQSILVHILCIMHTIHAVNLQGRNSALFTMEYLHFTYIMYYIYL